MKKITTILLTAALLLGLLAGCSVGDLTGMLGMGGGALAAEGVTTIELSDGGVRVNGKAAPNNPSSTVYVGATPIYYEAGHDSSYGEGTSADEHTADEAAAHTVVTITRAGTYRISGTLTRGQIFVDLGDGAVKDPSAVVTLMLDGMDVTCTVAPAVFFYNVYECSDSSEDTYGVVDTSAAGANVVICDGSVNTVSGSHVARIYKEGTTKKLHKYDAAFYSRMSMNISGEVNGDGALSITADNEGLDSELHLTINGGIIDISSQDDGINTNEDNISVTTINGGNITINAGLGEEGDGIDSNGYLTINGGTLYSTAHPAADGGIDAECPIVINGGTVYAYGDRNDAVSSDSSQPYIELIFANELPYGCYIELKDMNDTVVMSDSLYRQERMLTLSTPKLRYGETYHLYVNGVQQQYGMVSENMGMPGGFDPSQFGERPEGQQPPAGGRPGGAPNGQMPPSGQQPPNGPFGGFGGDPGFAFGGSTGEGSIDFTLERGLVTFSGVSDAMAAKEIVEFRIEGDLNVASGSAPRITKVVPSVRLSGSDIVVTITDDLGGYTITSMTLENGLGALNAAMPTYDGDYTLTIAVADSNEQYAGVMQTRVSVGALPFDDVLRSDPAYDAIKTVYELGIMRGTSDNKFDPDAPLDRAQTVTMLARMVGAEYTEKCDFTDVVNDGWSYGYIGWASENGIVNGYGDGRFGQYDPLTEIQLEIMLARLIGEPEPAYDFSRDIPLTRVQAAILIAPIAAERAK